jgi:hypothetical protein
MASTVGGGGDVGNGGNGGDDKVVAFPKTAEERRALRKAKENLEKQRLVNVFIDEAGGDQALFHTRDGTAYADLIVAGHRETWPVRSKQFRHAYLRYLQRQFDRLVGEEEPLLAMAMKAAMSKAAVNHAIDDFERRAICSTISRDVHVRVAGHDGDIYVDLCNEAWEAVRVTPAGWHVVTSPPVRFRRSDGMLPLSAPARGGTVEALQAFLNVTTADFNLVVAYLLAALRPCGPYPILILYGEHGTAKTTFLLKLRALVDPHVIATSALPSGGRDFFISAHNSHMQMFENVSALSVALSDHLCRLATGGGYRTRKLFKDSDEVHLSGGGRPIAFEGISNVVDRPDLQSRAIICLLETLPAYQAEDELNPAFESQRPGIFGALLDMMVRGLEMLPTTRVISLPRMADFAKWAMACGVENFEAAYAANRQNAINVMLSHDAVAKAVRALVVTKTWAGTMEDLLDVVGPAAGIRSTKKLSNELRRLIPALRTVGVHVLFQQRTAEHRPFRIERRQ